MADVVIAERTRRPRRPLREVHRRGAGQGQAGSAMMLVPATFLALIVFGALAFDLSRIWVTKRQLLDVAASAANDAAALAVSPDAYRSGAGPTLSDARATAIAAEVAQAAGVADGIDIEAHVIGGSTPRVEVVVRTEVHSLFARMAPGGWSSQPIEVRSVALLDTF